jgi:hypothetical protein
MVLWLEKKVWICVLPELVTYPFFELEILGDDDGGRKGDEENGGDDEFPV